MFRQFCVLICAPLSVLVVCVLVVPALADWPSLFEFARHYGEAVDATNAHLDRAGDGSSIDSHDLLHLHQEWQTPRPTATPAPTASPTTTPTASPTLPPSPSPTATNSPTSAPTLSPTIGPPTATVTPSPTWDTGPDYTCTPDPTWTPSPTPSVTPTRTPRMEVRLEVDFVHIPAGEFDRGSVQTFPTPAEADEGPVHRVSVDGFYLARFEITQSQFQAFIDDGGYTREEHWDERGRFALNNPEYAFFLTYNNSTELPRNDVPVEVSWLEARAFAHWAGGRLPTEAEWEKAAAFDPSTGHSRVFPWGDLWDRQRAHGFYDCWGDPQNLEPVGRFPQGASASGVEDLIGNAAEWVADYYQADYYSTGPAGVWSNPFNNSPQRDEYVVRGGRFSSLTDLNYRNASRDKLLFYQRSGFRIARDAAIPPTATPPPTETPTATPTPAPENPPAPTVRPLASFAIELVHVPGGRTRMGSDSNSPEEAPEHWVELRDYYIGRYEVTNAQFREFIADGGYRRQDLWDTFGWQLLCMGIIGSENDVAQGPGDWPVADISYYEAQAFCRWAGYRLPTEAEWEKAAGWDEAAQRLRRYPWGDALDLDRFNNPWDSQTGIEFDRYTPGGTYPGGVSPYGCHDMMGNAFEWVADFYDPLFYRRGPGGPNPGEVTWSRPYNERFAVDDELNHHVWRGGHIVTATEEFRVTHRWSKPAYERAGFRVAADPVPAPTATPFPDPEFVQDDFVPVPEGPFRMGREDVAYASPAHWVWLDEYSIGKYEVTVGEYRRFIEDYGYFTREYWSDAGWEYIKQGVSPPAIAPHHWFECRAPIDWEGPYPLPDHYPVMGVSFYEAEAYAKWAGGRLPTEAEWEKAASWVVDNGVEQNVATKFPWGNILQPHWSNGAYDRQFPGQQTSPVGWFATDRSPSGCYDMAGNLWEWCSDWYGPDYYSQGPAGCYAEKLEDVTEFWVNPRGPAENVMPILTRSQRGGSFDVFQNAYVNASTALRAEEGYVIHRARQFGFRIVKDAAPATATEDGF